MASVGITTEIDKVLPGSGARTATTLSVYGAAGETVSFQVTVTGPGTVTDITMPTGLGPVASQQCFIFREVWSNCAFGSGPLDSNIGGWTGRTPDGLIPRIDDVVGEQRNAFPFTVASGDTAAFWIDCYVPTSAPAGTFAGQVVVGIQGQPNVTLAVSLRVWGFTIPATSSLHSFFGNGYGTGNGGGIPSSFGVAGDQIATIRARLWQLGLDHRIAISCPDDGVRDMTHYNSFYLPLINGTAPTNLTGAKSSTVFSSGGGWGTGTIAPSLANFWNDALANGFTPRTIQYLIDEPTSNGTWSQVNPDSNIVHAVSSNFRDLVTATIQDAIANADQNNIDILCCIVNFMFDKSGTYAGNQRSAYSSWLASPPIGFGKRELWLYQSCMSHGCSAEVGGTANRGTYFSGWTSYAIDASILRARMMGWLLRIFQATGEVYYETMECNDWMNGAWAFGGQGDGTLFYAGTTSFIGGSTPIPCSSVRVKAIRGGYTDYEYLNLLDNLGDTTGITLANAMFPNPWTQPSQATFLANRVTIGNKIEQLLGSAPAAPPPPAPSVTWANPTAVSFGTPPQTPNTIPSRSVTKIVHQDQTVNRIQDQIIRTMNPALADMTGMPKATNGVFATEKWVNANLTSGFTQSGPVVPAFFTDPAGNVRLQGNVSGTVGAVMFQVPTGRRPLTPQQRIIVANGAPAVLLVSPDGTVRITSGSALNADIGGVSWKAEQ